MVDRKADIAGEEEVEAVAPLDGERTGIGEVKANGRKKGAIDVPEGVREAVKDSKLVDSQTAENFVKSDDSQDEYDPELEEIEALQGQIFDNRYKIDKELARGGMGIVFRAQHLALNRSVVIKVLKSGQIGSSTAKQRFEREARRACQLDHPNIVTVHDFGYHGDLGYLVMEFVDGITLYDYLKRHGPLTFPQFAPVAAAVLSGLGEAHRQGIVHRDIKSSNIMLQFEGKKLRRVKILDFGLAKVEGSEEDDVTKKSNLIGTMGAMPPERILCKPTDCRVDLYAFGITSYRMIAGRRPFVGEDMHVLYQHVHELPPPLTEFLPKGHEYPLVVLEWVHRLLAKDPDDRPRDANEARDWLFETMMEKSVFRLDEGEIDWMDLASDSGLAAVSGSFEFTSPSWSIPSGGSLSGSYRTFLSETGIPQSTSSRDSVTQLREQAPTSSTQRAVSQRLSAKKLFAAAAVAFGFAGLAGAIVIGATSSPKPKPVTSVEAPQPQKKSVSTQQMKNEDLDAVFARVETDLSRGAYGTAENLLNSVRDRIQMNTEYQVRAAEFQTRIDIDKNLRKARQAEAALKIEEAVQFYDAVLSLDAGNSDARSHHEKLTSQVVLKLTSTPVGEVFVDGRHIGTTPLEKLMTANFSRIEVRTDGYETWSASLVPDGGTRVELKAELERKGRARKNVKTQKTSPTKNKDKKKEEEGISNETLMGMD